MDASDMASLMGGMSDMGGMGMDSGSSGMFTTENQQLAHIYWYIIAAVVACAGLLKVVQVLDHANRSVQSRVLVPAENSQCLLRKG